MDDVEKGFRGGGDSETVCWRIRGDRSVPMVEEVGRER